MPPVSQLFAVIDTCVLVNFLAVDRVDLLAVHPVYRFVLTGHVRGEFSDFYPEQLARLNAALNQRAFDEVRVDALDPVFVLLSQGRRLGAGESAAIAYAAAHGLPVAVDDKKARKAAVDASPGIVLESTESLVVSAIQSGVLSVDDADSIKEVWEVSHRFKLPFSSFAERL